MTAIIISPESDPFSKHKSLSMKVRSLSPNLFLDDDSPVFPYNVYIPSVTVMQSLNNLRRNYYNPYTLYTTDVCDTPTIRSSVTKLLYYKFLDKWLQKVDLSQHVLGYLQVQNGVVSLIKDTSSKDDYRKNDIETIKLKVAYIENELLSMDDMYYILKKFVKSTNISWCNLTKSSYFIRETLERTLKNKMIRLMETK
jgi:hypothetical protein